MGIDLTDTDPQAAARGDRRLSLGTLQLASLAALLAVMYAPVGLALVRMWWVSDDYSHGFLVPFISMYMIWHKRKSLESVDSSPSPAAGLFFVILAGSMLVVGGMGGVVLLEELSLIVMIMAVVVLFWGLRFFRSVFFQLFYLVFMVKIFAEGSERFHWPFQLIAADIGIKILQAAGIPAFHEAQYIQLPDITLEVASACSGVRFLVAIIALGIPLAFLTQRSWPKRVLLVALGILIAILANGVRVALIGIWAYNGGTVVHGPLHIFQGVFVAWFGLIGLFALAWLLRDKTVGVQEKPAGWPEFKSFFKSTVLRPFAGEKLSRTWMVSLLLLSSFAGYYYFSEIKPRKMDNRLRELPAELASWRGVDIAPSTESFRAEGADEEVVRRYRNGSGIGAYLYIGYYDRQREDKKLVGYTTSWRFHRNDSRVEVTLPGGGSRTVNEAILKIKDERRLAVFWYDIGGHVTADRYAAKALTIWNSVIHGRSDGALVVISVPVDDGTGPAAAARAGTDLAREVLIKSRL